MNSCNNSRLMYIYPYIFHKKLFITKTGQIVLFPMTFEYNLVAGAFINALNAHNALTDTFMFLLFYINVPIREKISCLKTTNL